MELKVMTFNIRFDTPKDGPNQWLYRRDAAAQIIKNEAPDIVGTQEVVFNQLKDLQSRLNDYDVIGVGRTDGKEKGEFSAVFYRKEKFKAIDSGTFWLSETPDIPSKGWDAQLERIATWAILEDKKSGKQIFAINTHLDHKGKTAQLEGSKLILEKIQSLRRGLPVVLTGDFNITPADEVYKFLVNPSNPYPLVHTRDAAETKSGPEGTYHNFGALRLQRALIDYIMTDPSVQVLEYRVLPDKLNDIYLSDHAPVIARIRLNQEE
jgi:endonuclease/exonuclease/phosphatase family metal-dependent hydrolase